jgi:Holliday junction resolvasome RuvABC endonuclease subunit
MKGTRILSIDPGTRELGVAIFDNGELLYYGVKTIRARETPQDICRGAVLIVRRLISEYEPQSLAIKRPIIIQQSAASLADVIHEINQAAQQAGLTIYEFAPKTIHQFICGAARATKRKAAERIASRYGELARYLEGKSRWEELYYAKMFEAVGVGLTCNFQHDGK